MKIQCAVHRPTLRTRLSLRAVSTARVDVMCERVGMRGIWLGRDGLPQYAVFGFG